jgi:hypothetical protein
MNIFLLLATFTLLSSKSSAFLVGKGLTGWTSSPSRPQLPSSSRIILFAENDSGNDLQEESSTKAGEKLKELLIQTVSELRELQDRDGDFAVDFGVKGGELNSTSRAPQKVDYYSISKEVGEKADRVLEICNQLAKESPIPDPTRYLGDLENGEKAPLNGAWKLLFTTAADASFSKNSTRGAAKAQNVVNAAKGIITNIIDFAAKEDGTEPLLKQLNVVIGATATSSKRVELQFKYVKAILTKFLFFKFKYALYIPVPGPFITRCIVFITRVLKFGRKSAKTVPKAYFDVIYLDQQLRIHRTGEDNYFVQAGENWEAAKPFLE